MEKSPAVPFSPPTVAPAMRRWRRLLAAASWAYLIAVLAIWAVLLRAESWWPATVLMFSPRWAFALPLAVLLPVGTVARSPSLAVSLAAAAVALGPVGGYNVPWPRLLDSTPVGTPFRAMTVNMHYNRYDPKAFEDLIAAEAPDVLAVQEWHGWEGSALTFRPGWHFSASSRSFLASRHPIRRAVELGGRTMGEDASLVRYDLDCPAGPVHVFGLHAETARGGIYATLHGGENGPLEVQANSDRRRRHFAFLAERVAECEGPVLIMGDFNTPPESPLLPRGWNGFSDAFAAAGWGWGHTFRGAKTSVRIDRIFADRRWACVGCRVGPPVGSPHRPVIADLVLTAAATALK